VLVLLVQGQGALVQVQEALVQVQGVLVLVPQSKVRYWEDKLFQIGTHNKRYSKPCKDHCSVHSNPCIVLKQKG